LAEPVVDALMRQAALTDHMVAALESADFERDTPSCPGWKVRDTVTHLTVGSQLFAASAAGDGSVWERRNDYIQALTGTSPEQLKQRYAEASAHLLSVFESATPEELRSKQARHPAMGEIPMMMLAMMRTGESTIHGWDIQAAKDPDTILDGPGVEVTVNAIANALPFWFDPDQMAGLQRRYRIVAGSFDRTLSIEDGKAAWTEASGSLDVTLTMEPGDLALLVSGRRSSAQLLDAGRAKVEGDAQAFRGLSEMFKAYGGR